MLTDLPLSHQLPLSGGRRFNQRARGRSDGLCRLQDLLLEIQRLVRLLRVRPHVRLDQTAVVLFNNNNINKHVGLCVNSLIKAVISVLQILG